MINPQKSNQKRKDDEASLNLKGMEEIYGWREVARRKK
jgi:hypothetical protein